LGYCEIGREDRLFERKFTITFYSDTMPIPRSQDDPVNLLSFANGNGRKMLAVGNGGHLELHAKGRNPTWTRVNAQVNKGTNQVQLSQNVDWKVGDTIIVVSTDFSQYQTEERVITAINGQTLTVDRPFDFNHYGERLNFNGRSVDVRAAGSYRKSFSQSFLELFSTW
jgi:cell migration-inducing and hyaluronan-binding protein